MLGHYKINMALLLRSILDNYDNSDISEYFEKIDPKLSIRPFPDNDSLLLLSNEYKKDCDNDLYRECRSVIIEKTDLEGSVTLDLYASGYESGNDKNTCAFEFLATDIVSKFYNGTGIMVFNYNGTWHVSTARCTDSYKSFFNPKKSFGIMFDECLQKSGTNREEFFGKLDPDNHYIFNIIHYENQYIENYTTEFGENYMVLAFVSEHKNRTLEMLSNNMVNTTVYENTLQTIIPSSELKSYSGNVVVYRQDLERNTFKVFRVLNEETCKLVKYKPNYHNEWLCVVDVFRNRDTTFTAKDYMETYGIANTLTIGSKETNIIGMLCLLYKETAMTLNNMVLYFTTFDHVNGSFTKKNAKDFEMINDPEHKSLKGTLTTLQYAIKEGNINTEEGVINVLKNNVRAKDFIHVLKSIKKLEHVKFMKTNSSYYKLYRDKLIELVEN